MWAHVELSNQPDRQAGGVSLYPLWQSAHRRAGQAWQLRICDLMDNPKTRRYLQEMTRVRHVSQAASLAAKRSQGKAPDTVLHSARRIGIQPNKKCPAERELQQGHKEK